ncbi:MAG: LacI family DNA-binding transcriptional regulator [Planctomycetes bacterium]|nr:LacI family DNA-binding transcriptional regulator [Planctomycetota bacterium]
MQIRSGQAGNAGESGKPPVSIRQVAAAAGVSIATVSRAINTPAAVAEPTLSRVRAAIAQLGYTPNPLAQALMSGESRVIGIALPWFHGEFFTRMLQGADEEAMRLGYHLLVTSMTRQQTNRRRDRVLGTGLIDGMIVMIDDPNDPLAQDVIEAALPGVVMCTDFSSHGIDSVVLDNKRGTREAVEHLLRWVDASRCYFVGGPLGNVDSQERAATFKAVLAERGHEARPDQISFGEYAVSWGKEWAMRAHQQRSLEGAAILAANDEIACGVLRAAEAVRLWVPDQVRIVGFDDTRLAGIMRPTLSSVALPMEDVGASAVRALVARMERREAPATCVRLPTRLVVRESSTAVTF